MLELPGVGGRPAPGQEGVLGDVGVFDPLEQFLYFDTYGGVQYLTSKNKLEQPNYCLGLGFFLLWVC